jgi:hypothetical protein
MDADAALREFGIGLHLLRGYDKGADRAAGDML